ncbi:hypothetical protein RND81_05G169000 [Saponaria officinalis]|uniref:X8 domain-containing protein n=1 Tax=Saponaria officinalis TaxID=3572 RepID=A0AAW1KYL3_SAPOF
MNNCPITHNTTIKLQILTKLLSTLIIMSGEMVVVEGLWCVARSDASDAALQSGLDYACAAGADCAPLLQSGLCFLPNTLQAHASYAYNSFFQRNNMASGACDFSATATLAKTDPSYGACVYPSSPSTAGSITSTTTGTTPTNPYGTTPPYGTASPYGTTSPLTPSTTSSSGTMGGGSSFNPDMGPPIATTTDSTSSLGPSLATTLLIETVILLLSSFTVF